MFETVTIPARTGIRLRCRCGHAWIYLGKSRLYASCPRCRSAITLRPKRKQGGGN